MVQLLWKASSVVPQKLKPRDPAILDTHPEELKTSSKIRWHTHVYSSIIYNSQKAGATQMSISE